MFNWQQGKRIKIGYDEDDQDTVCHNFWKEVPEDVLSEIIVRIKRIKIGHDEDEYDQEEIRYDEDDQKDDEDAAAAAVVCHNFWNEAHGDVLSEIFVRLPDCRSAVQSSTVCHSWHSLILGNPRFIQRFLSRRLPYTVVFCKQYYQPVGQIFSEEWKLLHGKVLSSGDNYMARLPEKTRIRALCNDLLLMTSGNERHISNPITKEFLKLPSTPLDSPSGVYIDSANGYALMCFPPGPTESRFKVLELIHGDDPFARVPYTLQVHLTVQVFCSESREWERKVFHYPRLMGRYFPSSVDIVTCGGVLYWLESGRWSTRVIRLDLVKEQCGVVNLPSEYMHLCRIGVLRACGGEQEELRLIQVDVKGNQGLKVWRLSGNSNWILVHHIWQKKLRRSECFVVHPTNGDLLFSVRDKQVLEFNFIDATFRKIDELREIVYPEHMFRSFCMVLPNGYGGASSNLANMISNP